MRSWKFWLGLLVSVIFIALAIPGLNLSHFWQTLREANYWWILPGVAVYFVGVFLRTQRWRSMLNHIAPIPTTQLFPIVVIGYMGNNVYPARAGEVLRSYVLRRNTGVAMSASLATVVLERLFDGLVMLLFVFATLPFAPLPTEYRILVIVASLLFGLALAAFMLLASRPTQMGRLYAFGVDRLAPAGLRPKIHGLFDRFIIGLQSLRSPREMATILLTSILIWLVETLKYWFVMHAFDFSVSFPVLMLLTAVVNLTTTIPSTPGYVGTFHLPGIAILTQFGVDQAIATGYMVVLHAALWLPITLLGAFYMLRQSIGWSDMARAAQIKEQQAEAMPPAETDHDEMVRGVSP